MSRLSTSDKYYRLHQYPYSVVSVTWKSGPKADSEHLPKDAFVACILETGENAYIAKSKVSYQIVTGMTTDSARQAYIPHGCSEHHTNDYEVMTTDEPDGLHWIKAANGDKPATAILGGTDQGEQLFIGRTCTKLSNSSTWDGHHMSIRDTAGARRLGKVHPSHSCLYVPYNGREYIFPQYEVLCYKKSPAAMTELCRWEIIQTLLCKFKTKAKILSVINYLPLPLSLKQIFKKEVKSHC